MRLETESIQSTSLDGHVAESAARSEEAVEALREGINAAQNGDRAKARTALLRSSELDPRSESAWLWLASISEYPEELLVFLDHVLDINPHNSRALEWTAATKSLLSKTFVQRGIDAAEGGNHEFAAHCFQQALEYDQTTVEAWLWLAKLADSTVGKLSYLEKAVELDPTNAEAATEMASARSEVNRALLAEARSAFVSGKRFEAKDLLDAFIAEYPESEDGWVLRAHLADAFDEKIAAFENVLSINAENLVAKTGLESLKAIMATVEPVVETASVPVQVVEETSFTPEAETFEAAPVQESEPEEVEQPPAPMLMENTAFILDAQRSVENDIPHDKSPTQELVFPIAALKFNESKTEEADANRNDELQTTEEVVYFDAPNTTELSMEEVSPENPASEEPQADWSMNTIAFPFAFPGDIASNEEQIEVQEAVGASAEEPEFTGEKFEFSAAPEPAAFEQPMVSFEDPLVEAVEVKDPVASVVESASAETAEVAPTLEVASQTEEAVTAESPIPTYDASDFAVSQPASPFDSFAPVPFESPVTDRAIPMPFGMTVSDTISFKTGFETNVVRPEQVQSVPAKSVCVFCNSENPGQAFTCGTCLSTLTLSDLEMLLANAHADREVLRNAIARMEAEKAIHPPTENELTNLGIAYLNLRDFQTGYQYLHEASQLNPNNVVLGSQVNALLIRLDEIKRQEEVHDAMPKEKKILVVDDSATVRKLIAGKLEKCGHQVICAADGVEAIEHLDAFVPDLILLDITMPRMDGYQVCKTIRSKDATKDVPVVMISGKDGFFDKVRGRMAGTTGYITKPFGPETLMKAVETYLKGEVVQ